MPKVIIPLADGFEEIEAISIIDVLRRGKVEVVCVSIHSERKDKKVNGSHGITLVADTLWEELIEEQKNNFDMIILPGGGEGVENIENKQEIVDYIKKMYKQKSVAAICAAPSILANAKLLKNVKATSYPSFKDLLLEKGTNYQEDKVCQVDKLITSRGPATAIDFSLAILEELTNQKTVNEVAKAMLVL